MTDSEIKIIDFAATSEEAWNLAEEYIEIKNSIGLEDYSIGVTTDPVRGPNGRWGYRIYAKFNQPGEQ